MSKDKHELVDPTAPKLLTPRFLIAVLLFVVGIAWIVVHYTVTRSVPADPTTGTGAEAGSGPGWMVDLKRWNYVIGFALIAIALIVAAHKSTPLGRGRGVVVGMLGCFIFGLLWICVYYAMANDLSKMPVFNDLDQWNLAVGVLFMGLGFTFATRWE